MKVDLDYLRSHYASVSDEALAEVNRAELVDAAQKCYDDECARRVPAPKPGARARPQPIEQSPAWWATRQKFEQAEQSGEKPGWVQDAICVCSFVETPGTHHAPDAHAAFDVLQAAGIPCYIDMHDVQPERAGAQPHVEYGVLVPGALNLKALSILDQELWNPRLEAEWKAHFAALSDEELAELDPEVLCAGLADKIERLTKAYEEEIARRRAG